MTLYDEIAALKLPEGATSGLKQNPLLDKVLAIVKKHEAQSQISDEIIANLKDKLIELYKKLYSQGIDKSRSSEISFEEDFDYHAGYEVERVLKNYLRMKPLYANERICSKCQKSRNDCIISSATFLPVCKDCLRTGSETDKMLLKLFECFKP